MILTSHEPPLPHPNRRDMPPVGIWYYGGRNSERASARTGKSALLSVSVQKSSRTQPAFAPIEFLNEAMSELDDLISVYGNGFRRVEHKAEAIDSFKYHLAVKIILGPITGRKNSLMRF